MVIDRSLVVQPRTYRLPASADLKTAAITIRGENITMFVDGEAVLDEWEPHESQVSRVKLPGGTHRIKIEYYEAEGFAQMRFDIQRK